jgi:phosphoenolpyruvate carboxylase
MEQAIAVVTKSGKTKEELYTALKDMRVELVFTAHPTQAMRGSVRKKYDNLFKDLRKLLHPMPNVEEKEIIEDMRANVQVQNPDPHTSSTQRKWTLWLNAMMWCNALVGACAHDALLRALTQLNAATQLITAKAALRASARQALHHAPCCRQPGARMRFAAASQPLWTRCCWDWRMCRSSLTFCHSTCVGSTSCS